MLQEANNGKCPGNKWEHRCSQQINRNYKTDHSGNFIHSFTYFSLFIGIVVHFFFYLLLIIVYRKFYNFIQHFFFDPRVCLMVGFKISN